MILASICEITIYSVPYPKIFSSQKTFAFVYIKLFSSCTVLAAPQNLSNFRFYYSRQNLTYRHTIQLKQDFPHMHLQLPLSY